MITKWLLSLSIGLSTISSISKSNRLGHLQQMQTIDWYQPNHHLIGKGYEWLQSWLWPYLHAIQLNVCRREQDQESSHHRLQFQHHHNHHERPKGNPKMVRRRHQNHETLPNRHHRQVRCCAEENYPTQFLHGMDLKEKNKRASVMFGKSNLCGDYSPLMCDLLTLTLLRRKQCFFGHAFTWMNPLVVDAQITFVSKSIGTLFAHSSTNIWSM